MFVAFSVVGTRRLICTFAVIVGFIVSFLPQLMGYEQHPNEICTYEPITSLNRSDNASFHINLSQSVTDPDITSCMKVALPPLWYRLMWPLIYAVGFVPIAVMFVLVEKEMKKHEVTKYVPAHDLLQNCN